MATLEWQPLAGMLAAALVASGELRDPAWCRAFEEVPRHLFVPRFLDLDENGESSVDGADPEQRRQWLERVYSDTTLITQLWASGADGHGARRPTSSSSMPRIMAWMLDALDVAEGQRVLEIGTGTGYRSQGRSLRYNRYGQPGHSHELTCASTRDASRWEKFDGVTIPWQGNDRWAESNALCHR